MNKELSIKGDYTRARVSDIPNLADDADRIKQNPEAFAIIIDAAEAYVKVIAQSEGDSPRGFVRGFESAAHEEDVIGKIDYAVYSALITLAKKARDDEGFMLDSHGRGDFLAATEAYTRAVEATTELSGQQQLVVSRLDHDGMVNILRDLESELTRRAGSAPETAEERAELERDVAVLSGLLKDFEATAHFEASEPAVAPDYGDLRLALIHLNRYDDGELDDEAKQSIAGAVFQQTERNTFWAEYARGIATGAEKSSELIGMRP